MSELKAGDGSADDLGGSGGSTLPPDSDNWLVDDFLQARALAQHANVMARLDAFAAAHGAAADDNPDSSSAPTGGPIASEPDLHLASDGTMPFGLRLQLAAERLAPIATDNAGPSLGRGPGPPPEPTPLTPEDAGVPSDAAQRATVGPSPADATQSAGSEAFSGTPVPPDSLERARDGTSTAVAGNDPLDLTKPTEPPSDPTTNSRSGAVQSAIDLLVPGATAGREASDALKAGHYGTAALKVLQGMLEAAIAIGTFGEGTLAESAAQLARTELHHAIPQYLGGAAKQELVPLPRSLHQAYHLDLDGTFPRRLGAAYYSALGPEARAQMLQKLADHAKDFDARFGTKLYEAMVRNRLGGTP